MLPYRLLWGLREWWTTGPSQKDFEKTSENIIYPRHRGPWRSKRQHTHILRICVLKSWRLPGLQATIITNLRHRFLYPHGPLHSHSLWGAARGLPSITSWLRQKTFTSAKGTFFDEQSHQFAWVLFLRWFDKFSENVYIAVFSKKCSLGYPAIFGWGWVPWLGQSTAGSGSCTTPWGWKSAEIHQRYGILEQRNGSGSCGKMVRPGPLGGTRGGYP